MELVEQFLDLDTYKGLIVEDYQGKICIDTTAILKAP